ncbi:TPA: hypothetical protein DEO28_01200 [Candidatus Dependentiae bacterium]|nr:MAG: hypothetical protein UR14_C0003G0090 [candidate division TM6 bacterium GW2011_GWE2_31_21]KKP53746.1 MAG: hypothetical protein UR43_C0003G0067 [candidate division TM6 bacterium GW2011_GWF2_33_332]HBS48500.1 hypothetical protein [Candidatus Dependentiae bacterium]HBZ73115.1 hypothetical protein [Candidatus Dependentiae bacterium]
MLKKLFYILILSLTFILTNSKCDNVEPWTWTDKNGAEISFRMGMEKDLSSAENLFAQSLSWWIKNAFLNVFNEEAKKHFAQTHLICANKNETLVGFVLFDKMNNKNEIYLDFFGVDQSCRGSGLGKELIKSICKIYPQAKKITLDSHTSNPTIKFYKHLGFTTRNEVIKKDSLAKYNISLEILVEKL